VNRVTSSPQGARGEAGRLATLRPSALLGVASCGPSLLGRGRGTALAADTSGAAERDVRVRGAGRHLLATLREDPLHAIQPSLIEPRRLGVAAHRLALRLSAVGAFVTAESVGHRNGTLFLHAHNISQAAWVVNKNSSRRISELAA